MLPAAEVDAIVAVVADPLLVAAGFHGVSRRRWVRSFAPIRHVFEIALLKGRMLVPRWGISLDFVPHVRGKGLAWHRTEKSATPDLVFDPVDFDPEWRARCGIDTLGEEVVVRRAVEQRLPVAIASALPWFDGARDLSSVMELAEWLRTTARPGNRFAFEAYVQQPLAYAFLLARTGRPEAARDELSQWIAANALEPRRDELMQLLVE